MLTAQETADSPVILGVSEGAGKYMTGYKTVVGMVNGYDGRVEYHCSGCICIWITAAMMAATNVSKAGFSSVMFDGSHYADRRECCRKPRNLLLYAKSKGLSLEAEVGSIGGEEDGVVGMGECADPDECKIYR